MLVVNLADKQKMVNRLRALSAGARRVSDLDKTVKIGIEWHVARSELSEGSDFVFEES